MEEIKLQIKKEDLFKRLKTEIKGNNSHVIATAIVDTLEADQDALGKIFMASLGIEPALGDYQEGEQVLVQVDKLSDWMFNKDKMKEENMISKDDLMNCTITRYNRYTQRYYVSYKYIKSDETYHTETSMVSTYGIQGYVEDWPI